MCRGRSPCTFEHPGPVKSVKICGARTERDRPYGFVANNNNNNNHHNNSNSSSHSSANHLHTTNEPTGNAADKLEDRIIWVGDLHKLSTVGGDAVLVPLISSYLRRFGPLDQANPRCPLKVRQATGGQASLGYAFVAFEHSRFAEAALRNSVMPDANLKLAPHKESKYMHDVSWKQGEAEATTKAAAAVATTTPAAAVASAVTNRQPPAHISPPASPEASPPPAQFNTDAPPFASHRASSTTVLATSRSTPTERPGPARPSAHTAHLAHALLTPHSMHPLHMHMHVRTCTCTCTCTRTRTACVAPPRGRHHL